MMKVSALFVFVAIVLAGLPLAAQQDSYYDYYYRIYWFTTIEDAVQFSARADALPPRPLLGRPAMRRIEKKYIFVYVHPEKEEKEPNAFANTDIQTASRNEWCFVKLAFDKENPLLRAWNVKAAPAVVGLDIQANDFIMSNNLTAAAVRGFMKALPDHIAKYEVKLKSDFARAEAALKSDPNKGIKLLVEIVLQGKTGYKEATDAAAKLQEVADESFKKCEIAESVSPDDGIKFLEEMVKVYGATPPGAQAEIRIAKIERGRNNIGVAIARLVKVTKYESKLLKKETMTASLALDEISKDAEAKITAALGLGRAEAREALKKIAKEYANTDAGKRATEELKKLE